MSSIVAVSLSQTSTKSKGSSFESKENVKKFSKTKSSESRFSCYLNSNCSNQKQLKAKKQKRMTSHSKNNNNDHELTSNPSSRKEKILRLTLDCRKSLCRECSNLIDEAEGKISSNMLCSRCLNLIQSMDQNRGEKRIRLTKFEEEEVRRLIESMFEELQNHLGQTLTVSMRQMTQHLLSNVHCFYGHYQKEFEELTKRYRLVFLERFVDLMKRGAQTKTIRSRFQSSSRRKSIDHVKRFCSLEIISSRMKINFFQCLITRPPEKLRFSSVNNSSTTEKNQTDSVSLSTSSNHSITIDAGRIERCRSIPQEKSFTTDSDNKETSSKTSIPLAICFTFLTSILFQDDMSKNAVSSLLLDAYRFRETLNISDRESKIRQTNNIPKKLEL